MAINIAFAPALLYLVGLWQWPPGVPHLLVFAITTVLAFRYLKPRWTQPQLTLDERGLYCGRLYSTASIQRVTPIVRALKLELSDENGVSEKTLNLNWASRDDFKTIVETTSGRFNVSHDAE